MPSCWELLISMYCRNYMPGYVVLGKLRELLETGTGDAGLLQCRSLPSEHTSTLQPGQKVLSCQNVSPVPPLTKLNTVPAGKGKIYKGPRTLYMKQAIKGEFETMRQ